MDTEILIPEIVIEIDGHEETHLRQSREVYLVRINSVEDKDSLKLIFLILYIIYITYIYVYIKHILK